MKITNDLSKEKINYLAIKKYRLITKILHNLVL